MDGASSTDKDVINNYLVKTPFREMDKSLTNLLHGINHRKTKNFSPSNRDMYGYVFFTRPQLNMSELNLKNSRQFYPLLTNNKKGLQNYVRNILDPRLKDCPIVDDRLAFIPILTNSVKTVSGWPDKVVPTYTSKEGIRKEQWSIVDGSSDIYTSYDLNITFDGNIKDEPLTLLFDTWTSYPTLAFEGVINPYIDMVLENEIDYNTRIYRLIMSADNKYVKKIGATGASFPINVPSGQFFDYDSTKPMNDSVKDITIRFRSMGALYNDSKLIESFNKTVGIFNSDFKHLSSSKLKKVPRELIDLYNFNGYPYINPDTYELEWYVDTNLEKINEFNKGQDQVLSQITDGVTNGL